MGEQERYDVLNVLDFTRYVDVDRVCVKLYNWKFSLDCSFRVFQCWIWNLTKLSATGKNQREKKKSLTQNDPLYSTSFVIMRE